MQIFGVEARCGRGRAVQTQAPQPGADFHSAPSPAIAKAGISSEVSAKEVQKASCFRRLRTLSGAHLWIDPKSPLRRELPKSGHVFALGSNLD
jgi:hypothetical protein